MGEEKREQAPASKHYNLLLDMAIGAIAGSVIIISLRAGWAKAIAWAKQVKPDYRGISQGRGIADGAIGGMIGMVITNDRKHIKELMAENVRISDLSSPRLDGTQAGDSFSRRISENRSQRNLHVVTGR